MSFVNFNYHIVFATKERHPWLDGNVERIAEFIGGLIRRMGGSMLAGNGPADHFHLATILDQKTAVMDVIREIKSVSSGWIHDTFPDLKAFGWQDGYAGFTVSHSIMPRVVSYVRHQQEHHRKLGFIDELRRLLDLHEIPYDERYLGA